MATMPTGHNVVAGRLIVLVQGAECGERWRGQPFRFANYTELRFRAAGGKVRGVASKRPRAGMSSKTLRSLATLVLLLTAAAHGRAAVLYTFSSQAHSGPSSDFSFVVDDLLTTTTIVAASDLFDVITYIPGATLGLVGFTDPQTNPNIFLFYPDTGRLIIYSRWPEPFTRLGSYTPGTGVTLVISSVPEPSTLAMLSLALAALGFTRRRRRPR